MFNYFKCQFILLIVIIFSNSCNINRETDSLETEPLDVIVFNNQYDSNIVSKNFNHISCIQLEMTAEAVLGNIRRIIDENNQLIILSNNEIFIFNKENGNFIRKIGSIGEGPEEYEDITDMYYDQSLNCVTAFDRLNNNFISYNIKGDFINKSSKKENLHNMESLEMTTSGIGLVCNRMYPGNPSSSAFTMIGKNSHFSNIDSFSPVYVNDRISTWANKPLSNLNNEIKFVKFLSDTLFVIKEEKISPLYKMVFNRPSLSKDKVSQMGSFGIGYDEYCLKHGFHSNIDKIYETSEHIILIPVFENSEGYYWINKNDNSGFHIDATSNFDEEIKKVILGNSIIQIIGSSENEIISCFDADPDAASFIKAFNRTDKNIILTDKVINTIKNVDINGNPFLLIYSHD